MPTVAERISVVEVQVENLDEKLDEIKVDVKELHDCLDRTGAEIKQALKSIDANSCQQHKELSDALGKVTYSLGERIGEIEKLKTKWTYIGLGAAAALGWLGHLDLGIFVKFIGL